jgi:hypothetical protein
METSEALERQVHRIHELLVRSHEDVTWNDHIPDPDNPEQLRQIDITIRQNGELTLIECRLSKRRQDVKWIEELMGRRESLGAQEIIGVASAGFTAGAKKKAERYGVRLRDLQQLSADEIASWGRRVALTIYYYQYSEAVVAIGFAAYSLPKLDMAVVSTELRSHPVLQSVFNAAASQLDTIKLLANNDTRTVGIRIQVRPEKVVLSGEPVLEIGLNCKARLVAKPIASPGVFGYGQPQDAPAQREATVERFAFGETSIVHQDDRIAIDIDLACADLPPLSQIRFIRTTSADELDYESFAVNEPRNLYVTNGPIKAEIYGIFPLTEPPGIRADNT